VRLIASLLFLLFCFSIPIETSLMPLGFGVISTMIGTLAIAALLPCLWIEGRLRLFGPALLLWVGFLLYMCTTVFWSIRPVSSFAMMQTFVSLAALVILVVNNVKTYDDVNRALRAYGLGCIIAAVMTIMAQRAGQFSDVGRTVINEFIDANEFAMTLCLGVPALIAWASDIKAGLLRSALIAASAFICYAALITGSRMGFIMVVSLFLYGGYEFMKGDGMQGSKSARIAVVTVVSLLVGFFVISSLQAETFERLLKLNDSNNRDNLNSAGLRAFMDSLVLGNGLSTSPYALLPYTGTRYVVHNSLLNVAVDGGAVGLSLLIGSLISAAIPALRVFQRRREFVVIGFIILLGMMALHVEHRKMIWVMLPLVAIGAVRYREQFMSPAPAVSHA
jgi:hypothetical protein